MCELNFMYKALRPKLMFLLQHTSISPDCKLMTVVGDSLDALLVDPQNGKVYTFSHYDCKAIDVFSLWLIAILLLGKT